jgi:DNA polymerase-3 subunit alpha
MTTTSSRFVHLHCHSDYSLLDGALKVENMVQRASELGMKALALTDHGNLFGTLHFYRTCREAGINPILGMEAYVARGGRREKRRPGGGQPRTAHLVLLARDRTGYRNLMALGSIGFLEGFYYKPRVDLDDLKRHSAGLIALSGCLNGLLAQDILAGRMDEAREMTRRLVDLFEPGSFFLEIQDHGLEEEKRVLEGVLQLARETDLPLVATNDCHYLRREDHEAHEVLLCIQTGKDFDDPNRLRFSNSELYFKDESEMNEVFGEWPQSLESTGRIADACNLEIEMDRTHLPRAPLPESFRDPDDYLRHLAEQGFAERYGESDGAPRERFEYELSVIRKMGFSGYFLIVRDMIHAAKAKGIPVGPGRGSAAGSLVCYCLGITDLCPLEHGLLFERFLNPERVSMPDIDIDFCYDRRAEVIDYVVERYGSDNVCQIITFAVMKARAVIRDVGRVLKIPYAEVDKIAKMVPASLGITLEEALKTSPELAQVAESSETGARLIRLSRTLEGLVRHASTHAAGLVITPESLQEYLPLYRTGKGELTTQYDMKMVEAIGLLKVDILGLRTLTVIDRALKLIRESHGADLTAEDIPLDDPETFALLKQARTVGIFQLESSGMRDLIKRISPDTFSDVTAVNALFRPGPLGSGMVNDFIERKHGRKKIDYPHPDLRPVLEETYGVILYQEQVMQIANRMAGFSMAQADVLRKAMGKKQTEVMEKQRALFLEGAIASGYKKRSAVKIFDLMAYFAGYGFNKSHSAAYALITLRTAYLKAHYPQAFMAATLTSEMGDSDRVSILLDDCKAMEIEVEGPDVNRGAWEFRVEGEKIVFGLGAVKNVGAGAVAEIVRSRREAEGRFKDLFHLCACVDHRLVNRRALESLIMAGAMDSLPGHRSQLLASLELTLAHAQARQSERISGQFSFILDGDDGSPPLEATEPWPEPVRLQKEKDVLGFYFSGHPLDPERDLLEGLIDTDAHHLPERKDGDRVVMGGMVEGAKVIMDRRGNPMGFVTLEDFHGSFEAIAFSDIFSRYRSLLVNDRVVVLSGKISTRDRDDVRKVMVDAVYTLEDAVRRLPRQIHIYVDGDRFDENTLAELKTLLAEHRGDRELVFHLQSRGCERVRFRSGSHGVTPTPDLIRRVSRLLGEGGIRMVS